MLQLAASAQGQTGEAKVSLNGSWAFKTDPNNVGEEQQWFGTRYPAAGWEQMPVPGNWDTHNPYAHYAGKGWYRKEVAVPADWKGKTVRLHFEAVYHDARVWLNGKLLGESHSGFFPFEFDVTRAIQYGGRNTIVVCAGQDSVRELYDDLARPGVHLIGGADVAAELDAKRAIKQGTEVVAAL